MDTTMYAAFIETLPGGAAVVDANSRVLMMNARARELLGAPDVIEGLKLELGDAGAQVRMLRRFDGGIESLAVRTSRMTLEGVELVLALSPRSMTRSGCARPCGWSGTWASSTMTT
jgi:PAS domain-containing protein